MPSNQSSQPRLIAVATSVLIAIALAACSSNSSPSGGTTPSSPAAPTSSAPPSGAEPTTGAGAVAAIKANWATFFNAKTPNSRRAQLLQDGSQFAATLQAQSTSPFASSASAKVTHVSLTGTTQAAVTYTILVGGSPALSNQPGVAVYQNGVWKVGVASFCGLLKLENAGKTTGLPAVCKG